MAASRGKIKTVAKFLEDGGDVDIVDSVGESNYPLERENLTPSLRALVL